jgi:hypothetical protein
MANDTKVIHQLICDNGGVLTSVPYPNIVNMSQPVVSTATDAKLYEIGTCWDFNNRRYRYARASGTVAPNMGVKPYNHQDVGYSSIQAAAAAGATSIYVTTDTNDNYAGVATENELKGGSVVIFDATGAEYGFTCGIIGNPALAAYGTLRLDLDTPIPFALTTSDYAEAIASPWHKVTLGTGTVLDQHVTSCCGVPAVRATTGQYLWVQTKGPCWVSPSATAGVGSNNRGVWFQADGSITDQDASLGNLGSYAGWVMANDHASGQGAPFIWLQIE